MAQVLSVNFWENKTDDIINKVSSDSVKQSNRTQEQFFSDVQKTIADWLYRNNDEAIIWVLEYAKNKWVSYSWIDPDSIKLQIEDKNKDSTDKSIFDRFWETFEERGKAWAEILWRWVAWKTLWVEDAPWAIETWVLFWANFLWTLADLTWDVIAEWFTELDEFWDEWSMQEALKSWIESIAKTSWGKIAFNTLVEAQQNLEELKENNPKKWARVQWVLDTINWVLTLAGWTAGTQWIRQSWRVTGDILKEAWILWKETLETVWTKAKDVISKVWKKTDDDLLKKLDLETEKWKIWDLEVDIPVQKTTITEKVVSPFTKKTTKELAGRAVSPRTVWKNPKQKLKSISDVEQNTRKFYENIRTGILKWDIDTLENASQTIVNNIDEVWSRIWNAVKKVDWNIDIDNNITDDIINALNAKWSEVSPATPILKKFFDSLWDGKLNISDAYELKKAYSNEVTKLYKAWDAWTKQYKALSDGVKFLNTKIDDIIETKLWSEFAKDKELFSNLKTIVDDMVASSLVEWRRAPNTLAEQIWMVESIFSPVNSIKQKLIKTAWEADTRGWAWKELIKKYDQEAINNFKN